MEAGGRGLYYHCTTHSCTVLCCTLLTLLYIEETENITWVTLERSPWEAGQQAGYAGNCPFRCCCPTAALDARSTAPRPPTEVGWAGSVGISLSPSPSSRSTSAHQTVSGASPSTGHHYQRGIISGASGAEEGRKQLPGREEEGDGRG